MQYEVITTGIAQVVLIAKTVDARVGLASRVSPLVKKARDIDSDYKISQTLLEKAQQFGLASLGGGIYQRVANMGLPGEQTVESLISSVISTAAEKVCRRFRLPFLDRDATSCDCRIEFLSIHYFCFLLLFFKAIKRPLLYTACLTWICLI